MRGLRRRMWSIPRGVAGIVLGVVALVGVPALPAVGEDSAHTALGRLREQYAPIRSVHLKASVLMKIHRPGGIAHGQPTIGTGTFEYWADGHRYRVRSTSDPRLELTQDFDIAYNGSEFQLFDLGKSTLTIRQDDLRQLPIALPNPFFLAVDFLSQDNDDCMLCRLKLQHLIGDGLWSEKLGAASAVASAPDSGSPAVFEVPGGSIGGEAFSHRVYVMPEHGSLQKIERWTSSGRLMLRIELGAHEIFEGPGASSRLPRHISITTFNYRGDGKPMLESEFVVDDLSINPPLTLEQFTLPRETADYVYASEQGVFLKRPQSQE